VVFSTLTGYVRGLEKNEQRVKTVSAGQQEKMNNIRSACAQCEEHLRVYERLFNLLVSSLPERRIPINDLSAVCQGNSLSVLIGHNSHDTGPTGKLPRH
jgi:hypothetical protein